MYVSSTLVLISFLLTFHFIYYIFIFIGWKCYCIYIPTLNKLSILFYLFYSILFYTIILHLQFDKLFVIKWWMVDRGDKRLPIVID